MEENKLIDGIISRAEEEAAGIIAEAEKSVDLKEQMYNSSLKQIEEETNRRITEKTDEIHRRTDSAVKSEKRRQFLKSLDLINREIDRIFHRKIAGMVNTPVYSDFLAKLIAEGALAVDADEAEVSCSFQEKVTEEILEKAESLVTGISGRSVRLKMSENPPLAKQGIVVRSSSGRISYNNQIDARLRRFNEDVKMIITKGLKKE